MALPQPVLTGMRDEAGNFIELRTLMRMYERIYQLYTPRRLEASGILVKAEPLRDSEKPYRNFDSALGWGGLFAQGLDIVQAQGDHQSMIEVDQNMSRVAGAINTLLERDAAQASATTNKIAERKEVSIVS
jgi:thioesterase domain-containing protein